MWHVVWLISWGLCAIQKSLLISNLLISFEISSEIVLEFGLDKVKEQWKQEFANN